MNNYRRLKQGDKTDRLAKFYEGNKLRSALCFCGNPLRRRFYCCPLQRYLVTSKISDVDIPVLGAMLLRTLFHWAGV